MGNKLVTLDFGQWGRVEVPPELAMTLVGDQEVRDEIRKESVRVLREREKEQYTQYRGNDIKDTTCSVGPYMGSSVRVETNGSGASTTNKLNPVY